MKLTLTALKPLNAELNPIFQLLALLGAHHILRVSRVRVKISKIVSQFMQRDNEQRDARFLSLIYSKKITLHMFRTNNCSKRVEDSLIGIN